MKRKAIAAAWIVGATVPVALATIYIVGCCVLPFHSVMHKLMPVCSMAMSMMRGGDGGAAHEPQSTVPRERQQEPASRFAAAPAPPVRSFAVPVRIVPLPATPAAGYRSFITHGAVRCDQDIGLHVFVATFLI